MLEVAWFGLALLAGTAPGAVDPALAAVRDGAARIAALPDAVEAVRPESPAYLSGERAVSNWRSEAVRELHPLPLSALAVTLQLERPFVTRCVKLNNYWCIKRAGWNGEIGFDEEGHVGFATAERGADAAVTLLRRYYLDYDRKSALDIVRRWAPAECGPAVAGAGAASLPALSARGLRNTLRGRWLAARRSGARPGPTRVASAGRTPGAAPRPRASRVSAVPLRPLPAFKVPDIAVGLGERKVAALSPIPARSAPKRQPTPASVARATAQRTAAAARPQAPPAARGPTLVRPSLDAPLPPARFASQPALPVVATAAARPVLALSCGSDETRIRNYAARMVEGLAAGPDDDLKLFEPDGRPLPNLWRVMLAMSSFELGALRASAALIEGAVARATPRPEAPAPPASQADPSPDPVPAAMQP